MHHSTEIILRQMDAWYQSLLGSELLATERIALDRLLPHYFGRHFLQIGGPSETYLFASSPIAHKVRMSSEFAPGFQGSGVQGDLQQLPFLPDSVDVILVPHMLEFMTSPDWLLQQMYRILTPEGKLLILGFNPFSLWGIARWLRGRRAPPWQGQFHSRFTIVSHLRHHQFQIEQQRSLFFRPPINRKSWLNHLLSLEAIGPLFWPNNGAVYLIVAKKQVTTWTPLVSAHPISNVT